MSGADWFLAAVFALLAYTMLESGRALDDAIMELRYCAGCWIR